jgi:hypothetical protein
MTLLLRYDPGLVNYFDPDASENLHNRLTLDLNKPSTSMGAVFGNSTLLKSGEIQDSSKGLSI